MRLLIQNDGIGKALKRMGSKFPAELSRATKRNARVVQRVAVQGIRTNSLAHNSIQNWAPLSERYSIIKRSRGGSSKLLIGANVPASSRDPSHAAGALMRSIEVTDVSPLRSETGTNIPYARALDKGYAPRNLPARPIFLPAAEEAGDEMKSNWDEAIRRGTSP